MTSEPSQDATGCAVLTIPDLPELPEGSGYYTLVRKSGAYDPDDIQMTMELMMDIQAGNVTEYGDLTTLEEGFYKEGENVTFEDGDTVYVFVGTYGGTEEEPVYTNVGIGHVDNVIFSETEEESES